MVQIEPFTKNQVPIYRINMTENRKKKMQANNVDSTLFQNERKIKSHGELEENFNLPEFKRVQSVKQMIKSYQHKKSVIKEALCNLDQRAKHKIIFDDNYSTPKELKEKVESKETASKRTLFQSDEEEEQDGFNLDLKKQFDGEHGQQLLELQSKFKGDKRFRLDERFIESGKEKPADNVKDVIQFSLEEENKNDIDILQQVLGTDVKSHTSSAQQKFIQNKKMLRYDPTQSEHTQYEIRNTQKQATTKLKAHQQENDQDLKDEKTQQPLVSKDVFYKVNNDLKKTFEEQQDFSLLNLFRANVEEEQHEETDEPVKIIDNKNKMFLDHNPFHYDSSDDGETVEQVQSKQVAEQPINTTRFISETFFFKEDDFRLQEGSDFVERISSERNGEFKEQRRNLKHIMKAKVRNNHRKNNPFKKPLGGNKRPLGGNKRKKLQKIKKALKR